ncbi:MAG TPA: methyltransferase [Mucilaginibacter sp.]
MANSYFQFKQFTIHQDRSALKVSTDSCIFGAWIAGMSNELRAMSHEPRVLDIGAGTGLLMLMLAQQWGGAIDGIEIDQSSFQQANENIQASPWSERLQVLPGDIKSVALPAVYDLIISNPPFYEGDLTSPALHKNLAKHDTGLTLEALLEAVDKHSGPGGRLALLLPWRRVDYFRQLAAQRGWQPVKELLIRQTPLHPYFRAALLFQKNYPGTVSTESLAIHTTERVYTAEMEALLRPYYLYL